MLPLQLLRVRTRKGAIVPLFCTENETDYAGVLDLATEMIEVFDELAKARQKKKQLARRLGGLEAEYNDYKLVRGLAALLERRCRFESGVETEPAEMTAGAVADNDTDTAPATIHPAYIRKVLFEESSKAGFALTELERDSLIESVASKIGITTSYLQQAIWSDLEDNMTLVHFERLRPEELLRWYNLSLMQTLLFNCTSLEFSVRGGTNWKRVLRGTKRLGLMYELQAKNRPEKNSKDYYSDAHADANSDSAPLPSATSAPSSTSNKDHSEDLGLVCLLDGPLSLFKLTDRYGTSMAKLLPDIVACEQWNLRAWIVRKTMSGKKVYEFKITSYEAPPLLQDTFSSSFQENDSVGKSNSRSVTSDTRQTQVGSEGKVVAGGAKKKTDYYHSYFDSIVEEKFANKFEQLASGWKLTREPDPLILRGGRAFIPDFMFEKYGKKVYLEIVGFWTKQYLERKIEKLIDILSNRNVDLFIAINEDLACSKMTSPLRSHVLPKEKIIYYKNSSVPVKHISSYLKEIDRQEIERHVHDANLKIGFNSHIQELISIDEVAREYNIPVESAATVASRDNNDDYILVGTYFIAKSTLGKLGVLLDGVTRFSEASTILSEHSIPESCHVDLVSKLGFDIVWQSIDVGSAVMVKRKSDVML